MRKILLLLFFFLSGCSLPHFLSLGEEVDKVEIVKYAPYVKHYRAYFTRSNLQPIVYGKKYLYFYHAKQKDLSILLKRKNTYILYSLYHPNKKTYTFYTSSYKKTIAKLQAKGYHLISPLTIGATSYVAPRKYKKIKTILVEIKDYHLLQNMYKKAIKNYHAKKIKHIKTSLPKKLISSYYNHYKKRAKTTYQKEQIQSIGKKLQLINKTSFKAMPTKAFIRKNKTQKTDTSKIPAIDTRKKEFEQVKTIEVLESPKEIKKPYMYYLHNALYPELNSYLISGEARNELTYNQYNSLKERRTILKEEALLKNGSLEALITAYKKNKDPRYKIKILSLMKKVQEHK